MPHAVTLSRSARTLIARRLAGEEVEAGEDLAAYRELERAGLIEPGTTRPTRNALARRREFLPQDGPLSPAAVALLERRLGGDDEVTDENRAAYRELAAAGLMVALHTFAGGDESAYRFTEEGWTRRLALIAPSPAEPAVPGR
jgi:hypothetical protein